MPCSGPRMHPRMTRPPGSPRPGSSRAPSPAPSATSPRTRSCPVAAGPPQPVYSVGRLPAPPMLAGHVPSAISGSATWHEPFEEPPGLLGALYPALDPEAGCAEDRVGGIAPRFARMPYLAIGSRLLIRNDCTGSSCMLPVTGCAAVARLFNDRCVTCGTSPRGRVADLTSASFVALGGQLDRGCFNATITIGR